MTQHFKGDTLELQMIAAGDPAFEFTLAELDEYFQNCYDVEPFLLMLYDSGRMPFSDRVPRDSFVSFIRQAIPNAQVTGTFENYIFILKSIFGQLSDVLFDVPAPGKLEMIVSASDLLEFDFEGRDRSGGTLETFTIDTSDGEQLQFRGIAGIDSEAELTQLLSELIPAGIFPDITLSFFLLSYFGADDGAGTIDSVIDHADNQIVFFET